MTKEYTFAQIAKSLESGGMDDESIKISIAALSDAFAATDDETFEKKLKASGGAEGIASQLLSQYNKDSAEKDAAEETPAEPAEETGSAEPGDENGQDGEESPEEPDEEKVKNLNILLDDDMFSDDGEPIRTDEQPDEGEKSEAENFFNDDTDVKKGGGKLIKKSDALVKAKKKKSKNGKKRVKPLTQRGKTVYVLSLIVLIPVIIAVIAALTVLLLALYAATAVLAIACSVALVIVAAVGTALSLIAIVYGVIQLSVAVPIGLYEMGLGIIAGGVTLAASILLYNFVVRLVPFLFRVLFIFYRFLCRQISKLIGLVRGACGKL